MIDVNNDVLQNLQSKLLNKGYIKFQLNDLINLNKIKFELLENLIIVLKENNNNNNIYLDNLSLENFHQYITDKNINELRTRLISKLNLLNNFNESLFISPINDLISDLLGGDILIQKGVNLVIQRPLDLDNSELHRDYPSNSEFELVVWIPFVDCSPGMSIYIVDLDDTKKYIENIKLSTKDNWKAIKQKVEENPNFVDIKFGEAIIFLTPVLHGSLVHNENITRFSINYRLKGLFSPSGNKDPFSFWKILKITNFTKFALNYDK